MKKIIAMMVAISFFVSLASAAEPKAKEKKEELSVIKGPIVSLNIPQNQVVIKDSATTYDRVFTVDPAVYNIIKLNDAVEAKFVVGSNKIESIKVTKAAPAPAGKTSPATTAIRETKPTNNPKR